MNKPHLDLTGCKILVVDDVPTNLEVLYQTLHNTGYNVLVASDKDLTLSQDLHHPIFYKASTEIKWRTHK
jgi:CheY-like chemotaxis protein